MTERWLPVPGFADYEVSENGAVRRASAGHCVESGYVLSPQTLYRGYQGVLLRDATKKRHRVLVHRLVAGAFIGDVDGRVVHHLDGDTSNNTVANLRIVADRSSHFGQFHHTLPSLSGERNHNAVLTADDIRVIRGMRGRCSQQSLADRFGVNQTTISRVQLNRVWRHLP